MHTSLFALLHSFFYIKISAFWKFVLDYVVQYEMSNSLFMHIYVLGLICCRQSMLYLRLDFFNMSVKWLLYVSFFKYNFCLCFGWCGSNLTESFKKFSLVVHQNKLHRIWWEGSRREEVCTRLAWFELMVLTLGFVVVDMFIASLSEICILKIILPHLLVHFILFFKSVMKLSLLPSFYFPRYFEVLSRLLMRWM